MTDHQRRIALRLWWTTLAVLVVFVLSLTIFHGLKVRRLRGAASQISVGDTRSDVEALLGTPTVTFTKGFPPGGGRATVWGSCYGGPFNHIRSTFDGSVYWLCGGVPDWYGQYLAQGSARWPVVIRFDDAGKVISSP